MAVIATGFFDGVHLGHRLVIDTLVDEARRRGEESVVLTFWPHPRTVLQNGARDLRLLTTLKEKVDLLKSCGVDRVEVIRFTREFSRLSTEEYLRDVVKGKYGGSAILLGYDNRMGRDAGSPDTIAAKAEEVGLGVIRTVSVPSGKEEKRAISSTLIRSLITEGKVDDAASLLGYRYSLFGVVVAGNRLGRTIGFPTANMQLYEPLKLVPGNGAYVVEVEVLGQKYNGMCNIGVRPTVANNLALTIETNIFGFDEDIYGLDIEVKFIRRIRPEVKFSSLEELAHQLALDKDYCLSAE
ncbi:MAG: riboflavin biosynthesis protein RibF [Bacteroidales bacterium]|nr:riboflavin biosynthesis protein RibF [Bacteroidales bacterium]